MGDIGSLALGGAMAGLALLTNTILLLPILGGLYVFETLSVIAQVISFRVFHRRVLRMAPIHHHFEVGGWPEFTVIVRFWLLAGAARRARPRASSTPTSSASPGCSTDARPGGRPRRPRATPWSSWHARRGVTTSSSLEDRPGTATRTRARAAARDGRRRASARGARRRRDRRARSAPPTSWCRARACVPTIPRSSPRTTAGVPVRSEIDLAVERLRGRAPTAAPRRGHRHQRQDDGHHADRRDAARRPGSQRRGRQHRPPALDAAGDDVDVVVAEVSSFQLDVHDRRVRARRRGAAQRGRGPPRLARHVRRLRAGEGAASSRTRAPGDVLVVEPRRPGRAGPRGRRARAASSGSTPGRRRRAATACVGRRCWSVRRASLAAVPASGAAHDVDQRARRGRGRAARRAPTSTRSTRTLDGFGRARRTGCSSSASSTACGTYDDSKATNPHATASALAGFEHVVLIAGGATRASTSACCAAHAPQLRAVVAIGEAADEVEAAFAGRGAGRARRLDARRGARRRRARAQPGDTVLLSPGVRVVRLVRELRRARRRLRARGRRLLAGRAGGRCRTRRASMTAITSPLPGPAPRRPSPRPRPASATRSSTARAARRDGRGAQRRRRGDGAVGVVGRVAHRLRLALVLLPAPAAVDRARRRRVRGRGPRRLPAAGGGSSVRC